MGNPYAIGERTFDVPRLRVGSYERVMLALKGSEEIKAEDDPFGLARLNAVCGAIVEILHETNPDLTVAEVKDLVCVADLDQTLAGLMATAGKKRTEPGEGVSP